MKRILLLIVAAFVLQTGEMKASHVLGGEISWQWMGGDTFVFTATLYRDCNGIPYSATPIDINSSCGKSSLTTTISSGLDITPVCKKSCDRCKSLGCSFPYGVERYTMTTQRIVLNPKCCSYKISITSGSRHSGLTTISNSSTSNLYIEGNLNRCLAPHDNSPLFTGAPILIVCSNQCIVWNNWVVDSDSTKGGFDSLVYKLTQPQKAKGDTLAWTGGYNYKEPVKYYGAFGKPNLPWDPPKCQGFHLDTFTGDLMFKATKTDASVIAILVEEWRKDSSGIPRLIGKVTRDCQIIIMDCPDNKVPTVSGINGTSATSWNCCAETNVCLTINTSDLNLPDTVTLTWAMNIPGATFTVEKGKKHPGGTFCWKPTVAQIRKEPYYIRLFVKDDACPTNSRGSQIIRLYVKPKAPPFQIKYGLGRTICPGDTVLVGDSANKGYKYYWFSKPLGYSDTSSISKVHPSVSTWYYVRQYLPASGCEETDSVLVTVNPKPIPTAGRDTTICEGETVKIGDTVKAGIKYFWTSKPKGKSDTTASIIINPKATTTYYLQETNTTGCFAMDSVKVNVASIDLNLPNDTTICKGEHISKLLSANNYYTWGNGSHSKFFYTDTAGFFIVNAGNAFGCYKSHYFRVKVIPKPTFKLGNDASICEDEYAIFDAGSGFAHYSWSTGDSTQKITVNKVGSYIATVTASNSCTARDTVVLSFFPKPYVQLGNNKISICQGEKATFSVGNAQSKFLWNTGETTPQISTFKAGKYFVTVTNSYGCSASDTVLLIVHPKPIDSFSYTNDTGRKVNFSTSTKGTSYFWFFGDGTSNTSTLQNPSYTYSNNGTYLVKLSVTDSNGCRWDYSRNIVINYVAIKEKTKNCDECEIKIYQSVNSPSTKIDYSNSKDSKVSINIMDITGRNVYSYFKLNEAAGIHQLELDIKDAGVYLFKYSMDGVEKVGKFVKLD